MFSSRRAFSLVELFVVLAIVAILAMLLLAVFSRVRAQGEKTMCASNLKQLAAAMQLYLQDAGGAFPPNETTKFVNGVPQLVPWSERLESVAPIRSVMRCPSFPQRLLWDASDPSYQLGRDVSVSEIKGKLLPVRTLSQLGDAGSAELFTEKVVLDSGQSLVSRRIPTMRCGAQDIPNLHLDGANIAYVDGHVRWMSAEAQAQRSLVCGW